MSSAPTPGPSTLGDQSIRQFYVDAHKICVDAQFIINSLPNAEVPAVDRITRQLHVIHSIMLHLHDPLATADELRELIIYVSHLLLPLEEFLESPPPPANSHLPRATPRGRGRPAYIIDLARAQQLHNLGNSWKDVAAAMGVTRRTLYNHLERAGLSSARPEHTAISDDDLDEVIAEIAVLHPFVGAIIISGHLESSGIHVPLARVKASLQRVDPIGVLVRWAGIIKRRVYKVRGSNALWHIDGNEKLRPWGFYVHGCIDGFSRLIIYLVCCSNKRARTVWALFKDAVDFYGWPSRARGDYGTENNDVERRMKEHWGEAHRAFLRGRSLHNVRIERLWRDVRKDCLETFRQIFMHLERAGLLDMDEEVHRVCLFLVFHQRIQDALDRTRDAWNHHKLRTEHNRTPVALYELSRETALNRGYWTGDPGDPVEEVNADPAYGVDSHAPAPPVAEMNQDPPEGAHEPNAQQQRDAGVLLNSDDELDRGREMLDGFDFTRDDGNWGIDVYIDAVALYYSRLEASTADM